MDSQISSKKELIFFSCLSLILILIIYAFQSNNPLTKIVFCDVGQGDGAYLRIKNKIDILVDAGPDRKILDCLGKHMPFYDKKIELVIISHPDKDHIGGLLALVDRYRIGMIYSVPVLEATKTYDQLEKKIKNKKIAIRQPPAGYKIKIADDTLEFYWPPKGIVADTNDLSLVFLFRQKAFGVLFTGDIPLPILERLLRQYKIKTDILKIPHHGSKYNLSKKIVSLADPTIAVISCGKNNSYGHPAREVLDILKAAKVKIRRTDVEGSIIFKLPN